jgi:hypothetical protein
MYVGTKQQLLENLKEIIDHNIIVKKQEKYTMVLAKDLLVKLADLVEKD